MRKKQQEGVFRRMEEYKSLVDVVRLCMKCTSQSFTSITFLEYALQLVLMTLMDGVGAKKTDSQDAHSACSPLLR